MPDPNDILHSIKFCCAEIAKSKTGLGYDSSLVQRLGCVVFGSVDAVRDAIQAPDGQSWRAAMFSEAQKRGQIKEAADAMADASKDYLDYCLTATKSQPLDMSVVRKKRAALRDALATYQQQQRSLTSADRGAR